MLLENTIKPRQVNSLRKLVDNILDASTKEAARTHLVKFASQAGCLGDSLSPHAQEKLRKVLVSSRQVVINSSNRKAHVKRAWISFENMI